MSQEGPSFFAGDRNSPVAVCTLASHDLLRALSTSKVAEATAIIGPLDTENVGIERMLTTLLERPSIRWLIVCGEERRGPYQGQALVALFQNGVDPGGGIREAKSPRAALRMLTADHVAAVQRQVSLVDLRGTVDAMVVSEAIANCLANDPGPFTEEVELPRLQLIEVPSKPFTLRDRDPNGFFVIQVDRPERRLLISHYGNSGELLHVIAGGDAESLCGALVEWGLVTRLEHAAYIGRELVKAELALCDGTSYTQDQPLRVHDDPS